MAALSKLSFHLSPVSGNAKTGPIAVSTSSKTTCSPTCPFLDNGCYAQGGPLNLHWLKVTSGERGVPFQAFLQNLTTLLPYGSAFRHNQAGDLVHTAGKISRSFVKGMVSAVKKKALKAYTYTHHDITKGENLQLLKYANRNGFVVNLSCETEQQVDNVIKAGLPAVVVVNSEESRNSWRTKEGNLVLVCPAQKIEDKTCADCMLCHKRGKKVAIAFLAHGVSKKKANNVVGA